LSSVLKLSQLTAPSDPDDEFAPTPPDETHGGASSEGATEYEAAAEQYALLLHGWHCVWPLHGLYVLGGHTLHPPSSIIPPPRWFEYVPAGHATPDDRPADGQ